MTDSYMKKKKQREAYEEQKGEIIFGFLGGFGLLFLGIMNNFPINGFLGWLDIISLAASLMGICLLFLGFVAPALLRLPYKGFVFISKKIGSSVLLIFLTVIYIFIILPVGIVMQQKRRNYGFFTWNGDFPYKEKTFEELKTGDKNIDKTHKSSFLRNFYNIFATLIRHKRFYLIPAVVILVFVGLILFFAATNVVFNFFIYTLF